MDSFDALRKSFTEFSVNIGTTMVLNCTSVRELIDQDIVLRPSATNEFLGAVLTRPEYCKYALGLNYWDNKESWFNEDHFEFDFGQDYISKFYKGQFEQYRPEYTGCHKGDKGYLLNRSSIIAQISWLISGRPKM